MDRYFPRGCGGWAVGGVGLLAGPAFADDITEAMDQARKSYQSGDLTGAKQSLDLASQLISQKNAESFAALLPNALPGWKAEKPQTTAIGAVGFGASVASRSYQNAKGDNVEVQITGDSAMVSQIATFLNNPALAGATGKLLRVGNRRAIQDSDGNVKMVVANKFMISVEGSADAASKVAYAQAIDIAKLMKL
jgi:hypothetical protein